MSTRIESVYYFNYTKEIGFYDSVRDFTHLEMEYIGMAVSTEKVHVNSTPTRFKVDEKGTDNIREYVIARMESLVEISKELAINSPQYIMIRYADESVKYFKYDTEFCNIFSMAECHKVTENIQTSEEESPYALQKNDTVNSGNYVKSTYTQQNVTSTRTPSQKKAQGGLGKKILIGILSVYIITIVFGLLTTLFSDETETSTSSVSNNSESTLTPVSEPKSGAILSGIEVYDESEITITASGEESCVVKLKTSSGVTRLSFYVRAGDTVTVGVPAECLYVYFASGDTWYGWSNLFGEYTSYSMDDEMCDFSRYTLEYTLYPVNNGNFSETPIDASQF